MVARKFGVGIDLGGKQAKGMVLENLASDNAAIAKEGSVYFNTTDKKLKIYQDGAWEEYATAEELTTASGELQDAIDDINAKIGEGFDETNTVSKAIADEAERADAAEKALDDKIDDEIDRATTAEDEINDKIGSGFDSTNTVAKAISDETSTRESADSAIATDLLNLGKAIWKNYTSNKATSGTFYTSITNQDTSVSTVFNESDGGGLKFENKPTNMVSAIAVNNGNATDIAAQIYSKYVSNSGSEVQNYGTRLNINPNAIYYTKGTVTTATGGDVRNEIAVLKDIDTLEASVDDKLALKANAADVYTKAEIDGQMASVFEYKGSVPIMDALPTTGQQVGDVYNVENKVIRPADPEDPESRPVLEPWGMNVVWVGSAVDQEGQTIPAHWDELGQIIDLSPYAKTTDVAATYETIANCNTIRGRLDTLESDVAQLQSDVAALQALTALQPKKATYTNAALSASEGVVTWVIDYSNDIDSDDIQVTVKEVATGEEIVADILQSVGGDVLTGRVTISFESDVNIPADTYKAIIIG